MNSKILLVVEFVLMAAYLAVVFLVLDLKTGLGLGLLAAVSGLLFFLVWLLEKKREKLKETEEMGEMPGLPPSRPGMPETRAPGTSSMSIPSSRLIASSELPPQKPLP